jgi:aldehyde dehydrogenase (NAD+)
MADTSVPTPMVLSPASSKIKYEPLGVALVMSSWNYPLMTCIQPLATAIAAGNCAVIKPSEVSENTGKVLQKLVENYLDKTAYRVIQGGVDIAIEITQHPFDLIVFTGATDKGKYVAAAAAKNLVPCILELGGKSPTIIDEGCDLDWASKRLLFGRFVNSG